MAHIEKYGSAQRLTYSQIKEVIELPQSHSDPVKFLRMVF